MEAFQANTCTAQIPLNSVQSCVALCYPRQETSCCLQRIHVLESLGVIGFCSIGNRYREIVGFGALGIGRSSVVVLGATSRGGLVAVKSRRLDGKRWSLEREGRILDMLGGAGISPRPSYYSRDLIVMDYIRGPTLGDILLKYRSAFTRRLIAKAVAESLKVARLLDLFNILHLELSRPWRNLVFTESMRAVVVDLESSSTSCGNVTKLVGGLARALKEVRDLLEDKSFRSLLSEYRENSCNQEISKMIEKRVVEALMNGLY